MRWANRVLALLALLPAGGVVLWQLNWIDRTDLLWLLVAVTIVIGCAAVSLRLLGVPDQDGR